jgi:hypothetical protein
MADFSPSPTTRRLYFVSATHATRAPDFTFTGTLVRVSETGDGCYYATHDKLGCGRNYRAPESAIAELFRSSACTVTHCERAPAEIEAAPSDAQAHAAAGFNEARARKAAEVESVARKLNETGPILGALDALYQAARLLPESGGMAGPRSEAAAAALASAKAMLEHHRALGCTTGVPLFLRPGQPAALATVKAARSPIGTPYAQRPHEERERIEREEDAREAHKAAMMRDE